MDGTDSASPLQDLRDTLYSRNPSTSVQEGRLSHTEQQLPQSWKPLPVPPLKKKLPFATVFLFGAVGFFIVAGLVATFLFLKGTRAISSDRIVIGVTGPTTIASGDTVPLSITIRNNNPALITGTALDIDFPAGSKDARDTTKALDHYHSDTVGDLASGAETTVTVSAVLFGAQNETITVPVRFQYRTAGSNAVFVSNKTYTFVISTSPVSVQVQTLSESASGQPITVRVAVHSNASIPLSNIALAAKYPDFGFAFGSADPKPSLGSFFPLGTLSPGETKTIVISGVLNGEAKDERTFSFEVGTAKDDGTSVLVAPYTSSKATIAITQPFLGTTLSLNSSTADDVRAGAAQQINASLTWQNNLDVPLSNASAVITLSGNGFDTSSVKAIGGFYNSNTKTITFAKENNPGLALLHAGDTGVGTFSFSIKPLSQLQAVQNPTVTLAVSVAGQREGQGRVPEKVTSTVVRTIKIGTTAAFTRSILHTTGPFSNTGPVPPTPGAETTYTVVLKASNAINSVGAAKASMLLPSYVRFTGQVSPQNAVTYNADTRMVSWNIGDLPPGATTTAYFQVAFLPSVSQVHTSPVLIEEGSLTGTDRFTGSSVSATADALPLNRQADPGYTQSFGAVQ